MDIISYGIANKAGAAEKKTRTQVLATGVQGRNVTVKERLDSFDFSIEGLTRKANQLIINDAVNIMKSHARLNAIAKSSRYKMENMIFDDFLTLDGVDTIASKNIEHDNVLGEIRSKDSSTAYEIQTIDEPVSSPVKSVLLQMNQSLKVYTLPKSIVSVGKPVRAVIGNITNLGVVTDGFKFNTGYASSVESGPAEIEVDLKKVHVLDWINVYHYFGDNRYYKDVRFSVSADGESWTTVFDAKVEGNYITTSAGKKVMLNEAEVRYIRCYSKENSVNLGNHWVEVEAYGYPKVTEVNMAVNKPVKAISGALKELKYATDGRLDNVTGGSGWTGTSFGPGEIEIDLQEIVLIDEVRVFHYWHDSRSYRDVLVRVSEDGVKWTTIFDGKVTGMYTETIEGKSMPTGGKRIRYIRCYNNGSTSNDAAHWSEVMALQKISVDAKSERYEISRDKGNTWQQIIPEELLVIDPKISLSGNSLRLKAIISGNKNTQSYALTWT